MKKSNHDLIRLRRQREYSNPLIRLAAVALFCGWAAVAQSTDLPGYLNASFVPVGAMNSARNEHTATLLQNGKVLITGGQGSDGGVLDTAELFDPATGASTSLPNMMSSQRFRHTATLLPNGKVLIAGGGNGGQSVNTAELFDPATGNFTLLPKTMRSWRDGHTATLLQDGNVLIVGGQAFGTYTNSAELFDPSSGTFTSVFPMAATRIDHTATLLPNGKVLITGGLTTTDTVPGVVGGLVSISAELYDPVSRTFSSLPNMSVPRARHTATLLTNGKVLVTGGLSPGPATSTNSADLFDPDLGIFVPAAPMNVARYFHSATLLPNGKILIAGGFAAVGDLQPTNTVELYDPVTGTFAVLPATMSSARGAHSATLLPDGELLIAGGYDGLKRTASADLFQPALGSFTSLSPVTMASVRFNHTATLLPSGKVLIAGGDGDINSDEADVFDPTSGIFKLLPSTMTTGRSAHTATLLPSGKVLITGGVANGTITGTNAAELFDPVSETFSTLPMMTTARIFHTATLLPNGKVLIAGGFGVLNKNSTITNTAELFDPASETFTELPPMTATRGFHKATLLPDGRVLVVGGIASDATNLNTAELFDPNAGTFVPLSNTMTAARLLCTLTPLPNGKILIAGGAAAATAELFDPGSQTFMAISPLNSTRTGHTATLLPSGKVLIAGGVTNSGTILETAELFDPALGTFTSLSPTALPTGDGLAGRMNSRRGYHTATLLSNGKVLLAGGLTNNGATNSAELFDTDLGFSDARRPMILTASNPVAASASLGLSGSHFRGDSESSAGGTNSSATDYPLVQLQRIDNEQMFFVLSDPTTNWSDTAFTSQALSTVPPGPYRVTIFTNAIPSLQKIVNLEAAAPSPVPLITVVSRKIHGTAGNFDIDLTNGNGIECRSGGANGDYTLVFTFANPLTTVNGAGVTSGTGSVSSKNIDPNDAHNYVVNLTGVTNVQRITVGLTNVTDSVGNFSPSVSATMGVLIGDMNGNGLVNSTDSSLVQAQSGQAVTSSNFRMDINGNGIINSTDTSIVRSNSGSGLP